MVAEEACEGGKRAAHDTDAQFDDSDDRQPFIACFGRALDLVSSALLCAVFIKTLQLLNGVTMGLDWAGRPVETQRQSVKT